MNNLILDQLNMLKSYNYIIDDNAEIINFTDNMQSVKFIKNINATYSISNTLEVEKNYIVELANYIVNEPDGFTLSTQWNAGVVPKSNILKLTVLEIRGKMCRIRGIGYDLLHNKNLDDSYNNLWLPIKSIKILNTLY